MRIGIDPGAIKRAKARMRELTSRSWGVSMERRIEEINRFTVGWAAYYQLADSPWPFERLDKWPRRRLRQVAWKQWRHPNARRRALLAHGIPERDAIGLAHSRRYWRIAGSPTLTRALPNAHWQALGLKGLLDPYRRFRDATRTAGCGPACPVVWEGPG